MRCSPAAAKSTARMNAAETLREDRPRRGQGRRRARRDAAAGEPAAQAAAGRGFVAWLDLRAGRRRQPCGGQRGGNAAPAHAGAGADPDGAARRLDRRGDRRSRTTIPAKISAAARNRYLEAALDEGNPSKPLRALLEALLARPGAAPKAGQRRRTPAPIKRKPRPPPPPDRRLRIYALDPSVAKRLDSVVRARGNAHRAVGRPAGDGRAAAPGPGRRISRGGRYRSGVEPRLRSRRSQRQDAAGAGRTAAVRRQPAVPPADGLCRRDDDDRPFRARARPPGAVGAALRRVQGRRRRAKSKGYEVPRLRIYPHALRTDNAYYSPDKKALLFGYFPAESKDGDTTTRGLDGVFLPVAATSSRTRCRMRCSTACTAASRKRPTRTCRPSTRHSPTSSRCSSTSP